MRRYGAGSPATRQAEIDASTAQRAAEDAKQCEETARNRADLDAQWRAAYAAENGAAIGRGLRWLALIEISLLIATVTAAFMAVSDGRTHAERELRAYVNVEMQSPSSKDGVITSVEYTVKNTGQTPAYDVHIVGDAEYHAFPQGGDFSLGFAPYAKLILHSQTKKTFAEDNIPHPDAAQLAALNAGEVRLFCFGTAYYQDVFRKQRFTNYCFMIWVEEGRYKGNYYDRHNEADDPRAIKTRAKEIPSK